MDLKKISINRMSIEDFNEIKDNLKEEFDEFWNENILKSEIESQNSIYFTAKENDEVIGFAGVLVLFDSTEITNIVIKKNKRGFGISKLLLEKLIDESVNLNKNSISLEVNENNTIAINLYNKYNFNKVGFRKNYYNGKENAIIMTKNI